ncbi:MAG TPA: YfhO family protein [Candidatus Saccharimonadales bacterium]|nr:YfhO family protein [Candidatus Saccharimonadales bacterium]
MKKLLHNYSGLLLITIIVLAFFFQFFVKGLLPIPSDTIIGLYHPFRDLYAKDYSSGIPYKNFLITDPVRQQYPWRELAVTLEKKFELPLWNPYSFSGYPLLANFQSAVFYPWNILLYRMPLGWSLLIIFQPLLAGIFLYLYLNHLKLNKFASTLGAITFAFCGFSIAWMEWGTIIHTALWLPLILLSIDKILTKKNIRIWFAIFILSLTFSFFAGHLQTFFYLFIMSLIYILARWWQYGKKGKTIWLFIIGYLLFALITIVQWFPTLQFILLSNRSSDQSFTQAGWFIPWQHLIQFVAPDFFGNPTTLNYWGVWNYAEFIGYVGILPLIVSLFALFFRRDKKTLFFGTFLFLSLIFALPTGISALPFVLKIPFLSTAQPTRLMFITDFCLSILAALGFDYFLKSKKKTIIYPIIFLAIIFAGLWIFVVFGKKIFPDVTLQNFIVAKQNLYIPSLIFIVCAGILIAMTRIKQKATLQISVCILVGITIVDIFRFGWKFLPFTSSQYLFPQTTAISFLQKNSGAYRIMTTDSRILPPNFSSMYHLQSIEGYDPLYLSRYAEFISAMQRKKPDISPPFGFNRIITPHDFDSAFVDLLGVKYIVSLSDLKSAKLTKVFAEGQTQIYENKNVLPRVFFVETIENQKNRQAGIAAMFGKDLKKTAIVETNEFANVKLGIGQADITNYSENSVKISTKNDNDGFIVLTDIFYPSWHATIDGKETKIYPTDYTFRGIFVPRGNHEIVFYDSLF